MSIRVKLRLEALTDRVVPASYSTATDPSDWADIPADVAVMNDLPLVPDDSTATAAGPNTAFVTFAAEPAPSAEKADAFKTVDEVKDKLKADPNAKALLDNFEKDGGKVQSADAPPTGANFDPVKNIINLDPKRLKDINEATSALLYELIRYKYAKDQLDLDQQAKDGKLTKEQYATKCEELSYKYITEHSKLAKDATKNSGWDPSTDRFGPFLKDGGDFDTFEKYLAFQKKNPQPVTHYQVFENRYDSLQKK